MFLVSTHHYYCKLIKRASDIHSLMLSSFKDNLNQENSMESKNLKKSLESKNAPEVNLCICFPMEDGKLYCFRILFLREKT